MIVGSLTSQQHVSISQGRICSDNFTCCHTELEVADPTSHLTQSPGQPVPALTLYRQAPGRVATGVSILKSLVWLDPGKIPARAGFEPGIFHSRGGRQRFGGQNSNKACVFIYSKIENTTLRSLPRTQAVNFVSFFFFFFFFCLRSPSISLGFTAFG